MVTTKHDSLGPTLLSALLLLGIYVGQFSLHHMPQWWANLLTHHNHYQLVHYTVNALLFLGWYIFIVSCIQSSIHWAQKYYNFYPNDWINLLTRTLKTIVFIILFNEACTYSDLPDMWQIRIHQANRIIFLITLGLFVFQLIQKSDVLLAQYTTNMSDSVDARRRYTYIVVIKRVLLLLWMMLIIAAILMSFERIRIAGKALLASAGVLTAIVALSARVLLDSIFTGIQLAISQPIRVEDTVTINGETGTVTSITLHHVVITLYDRSQLIIPTSDLLNKTFKNWTHSSNDIMGNITLYVTHKMPIEPIRQKFQEILEDNKCWDKSIANLTVHDFKGGLIELKLVVSAKSAQHLANLLNTVREQLLYYMQQKHPEGLA